MADPHDFQGIVTKLRTTKGSPFALDVMRDAADVIDAVLALHVPETYYAYNDIEDDGATWFTSLDRLRELFEQVEEVRDENSEPLTWEQARVLVEEKTFCAHCMLIVEEAVEPYEVPFSPLASWPCSTVKALGGAS